MSSFRSFSSWSDLLAYAATRAPLAYRAPLDLFPRRISYDVRGKRIRVIPLSSDADAFTADAKHLARFRAVEP